MSELYHYGVKGMKWGVRKEYVPHPRKRSSKYESEDVSWEATKKTNKKSKAKSIAKGVAIGVGIAAVAGLSVYAIKKYNTADAMIKAKSILSDVGDKTLLDISNEKHL